MRILENIRHQLGNGQFEFSQHAFKRAVERNISDLEIRQAGQDAQRIEDYPDDKYAPKLSSSGFHPIEAAPAHSSFLRGVRLLQRSLPSMNLIQKSGIV